jgi:hypothetical protein
MIMINTINTMTNTKYRKPIYPMALWRHSNYYYRTLRLTLTGFITTNFNNYEDTKRYGEIFYPPYIDEKTW